MIKEFIKFGIVGAINTILNYIIYILCIDLGMHYVMANIISFIIIIFNAFLLQNKFVFNKETENTSQKWWIILLKTYMSYAFTGLFLTNIFSWIWIDVLDLSVLLHPIYAYTASFYNWESNAAFVRYCAPFFNCIIMIPVNFIINKFWTYRRK